MRTRIRLTPVFAILCAGALPACSGSGGPTPRPAPEPSPTTAGRSRTPAPRIELALEAGAITVLDSDEMATRPTDLVATDRRAWRLSELLGSTRTELVVHAFTADGQDYAITGDGRHPKDVLVVRRNTGELYVGWRTENASDDGALADIERPAQRIEHVVRLAAQAPVVVPVAPPAVLTIVLDGQQLRTVTAETFPAAARVQIRDRTVTTPAIDVRRAFGTTELVSLEADGAHIDLTSPRAGARPVVYLNRRERFKFAWVDATGVPIGEKQREVTQLALRTRTRAPRAAD